MNPDYQERLAKILTTYTQKLSRLKDDDLLEGLEAGITSYIDCMAAINALNGETIGAKRTHGNLKGHTTEMTAIINEELEIERCAACHRFGVES